DAILTIAEEENKKKENHSRSLVFGLLDCCVAMFLFLPFFGQKSGGVIQSVSLLSLTGIEPYVKIPYLVVTFAIILWGVLLLTLQNCKATLWLGVKDKVSLTLSAAGALIFIISQQPYAAAFTFIFFVIKALMLIKHA
ncbi:MAG: XRE family transcriptional regulator, partial [Acutalibacteraceae bacterium]